MVSILKERLDSFVKEVETLYKNTLVKSDKDLGLYLMQYKEAFLDCKFKESKNFIFLMRQGKFYSALNNYNSITRRKIFTCFKPKYNILKGYVPSSAINRFSDDI